MAKIGEFFFIHPDNWLFSTHNDVLVAKVRAQQYELIHNGLDGAEYEIEEFVRQWVLRQLIDQYDYPVEWIGDRVIIEESVKMGSTYKQADVSIKNTSYRTYVYIEVKKRGVSGHEYDEAESQLESYLAATHTATIGMVTDGDRVRSVRKKIDPNDFDYIPDIPAHGKILSQKAQLVREIPDQDGSRTTGLQLITSQYERKLFDAHSEIRDTDGLHDDEALDELAKIIFTKIYDERATCEKAEGTPFRFQVYGASSPSEAASSIRDLYEEAVKHNLEVYSQRIPGYERSRGCLKHLLN